MKKIFRKVYKLEILLPLVVLLVCVLAGILFMAPANSTLKIPPQIKSVKEVGRIQNINRPQLIRDGGSGARVGDKYLWTFGDTLFNPKSVDGTHGRSSTAGYAELTKPFQIEEPLDVNSAPSQFIPLSSADQAYNEKTKKGDDRYAIWPGLVVPRPEKKDALIYFTRLKVNPGGKGLNYDLLNTGIARVAEGATTAEIIVSELFRKPEHLYVAPGFTKDGLIYLYECPNTSLSACSLARVNIQNALLKKKYEFWDGKNWQGNYKKAAKKFPGSSAGTGIGYLSALDSYVIFYNKPFSKELYFSTSQKLTSGWSNPEKFYTAEANNYALTLHPDLSSDKGVILSYYQPRYGLRALSVTF